MGKALPRESWDEEYNQLCENLYDVYLNELYYERVAARMSLWNKIIEGIIAAFATGSAISAWQVWQNADGKTAWAVLAGIASALSLLKPLLGIASRLETAAGLVPQYRTVRLEFAGLINDLRVKKTIDEEDRAARKLVLERVDKLELQDTVRAWQRLLKQCVADVYKRYPPESLWIPEFGLREANREREEAASPATSAVTSAARGS